MKAQTCSKQGTDVSIIEIQLQVQLILVDFVNGVQQRVVQRLSVLLILHVQMYRRPNDSLSQL